MKPAQEYAAAAFVISSSNGGGFFLSFELLLDPFRSGRVGYHNNSYQRIRFVSLVTPNGCQRFRTNPGALLRRVFSVLLCIEMRLLTFICPNQRSSISLAGGHCRTYARPASVLSSPASSVYLTYLQTHSFTQGHRSHP